MTENQTQQMDEASVLHTIVYKLPHARYFAILARQLLADWWSVPTLLVAFLSIATCQDLRFGIVLLLLLLVALPLCVFLLYYSYALRPECFYSVAEKCAVLHQEGIDCEYGDRVGKVLAWRSVKRVAVTGEAYLLYTGRYVFFYLPFSAFETVEALQFFSKEWLPAILAKNRE